MTHRIRENFEITYDRNRVSGHEWPVHGPTTSYSVLWRGLEVARVKTAARAASIVKERETQRA